MNKHICSLRNVASEPRSHHLTPGAQKRTASSRSDWPVRSAALSRGCDWPVRSARHCRREHTGQDAEDWYHSCETSIIGIIIINIINAAVESLPPVVNAPGSTRPRKSRAGLFWGEIHCLVRPRGTFKETLWITDMLHVSCVPCAVARGCWWWCHLHGGIHEVSRALFHLKCLLFSVHSN